MQGTTWLLLCKELEVINLFQTSQSVAGYAQLLQVGISICTNYLG
jgi:hypothetical protein